MLKIFLTFHIICKIFFQIYSLTIINAHQSLAKKLQAWERGLGESSGLSHQLARGWWVRIGGGGGSFSRVKSSSFRYFLLHKLADLQLKTW